jgi:DNA-binding protein HU-beta
MNKGDLIERIAEQTELPKKHIAMVLDVAVDEITEAVAGGDKVTLVGFGSFERRDRKEREGRNPKTGETMVIPATKVPAFSAGKGFKAKVAA